MKMKCINCGNKFTPIKTKAQQVCPCCRANWPFDPTLLVQMEKEFEFLKQLDAGLATANRSTDEGEKS